MKFFPFFRTVLKLATPTELATCYLPFFSNFHIVLLLAADKYFCTDFFKFFLFSVSAESAVTKHGVRGE